jgi:transposase
LFEPTGSQRDAASVIFNLPGYRVVDAVDLPLGGRRVKVQPVEIGDGCPDCGVVSVRVHAWTVQRVRDIPHAGSVQVVVRKPRLVCAEPLCGRRTFTSVTAEVPLRARCTTRLRTAVLTAVIDSGRAVAEVADAFGIAWWTVQSTINTAAVLLPEVDQLWVRRLGIDEHRYRSVRWFRDDGGWRRLEPWMSTIVDADSGQVLGIVDGRDSAAVGGWLSARSQAWRDRIQVVAIDPSAAFRKAIVDALSNAQISVDPFHLVQLANLMVTRVRQRLVRDREQRRGRKIDPAWAHRMLLLRGYDTLSARAKARLDLVFTTDDPTCELSAAWGVKEQLRRLLHSGSVEQARHQKMILGCHVLAADMDETWRLWGTICAWWPAIEVLIATGVTNARTEAANTGIKQIKRISVNRPSLGGIAVVCGLPESAAERADTGRGRCSRRNADGVSGGGCRWRAQAGRAGQRCRAGEPVP